MDVKLCMKFRDRLVQERVELQKRDDETVEDRAPVTLDQQSVGRLSRMDAMQQQAMAAAQARRRAGRAKAIEEALRRIDDDEFGWCQSCGDAIVEARLHLDPTAAMCVACAR